MPGPSQLHFQPVSAAGLPLRLTWPRPRGQVCGYVVLGTPNPFPPNLAPELFAGRMREHMSEHPLGPEAAGYQTERADRFYAVLWLDERGQWHAVDDVREGTPGDSAPLALDAAEATQPRTLSRARFSPQPTPNDQQIDVFVRSDPPDEDSLAAMLTGLIEPDFAIGARCDGFIDNVTEHGFRVYYVAVARDLKERRRPLGLTVGPFQRLERPALLAKPLKARVDEVMDAVCRQLDIEISRKSADVTELRDMLARARDLGPAHPALDALEARARDRFPEL